MMGRDARMPTPLLRISMTASVALRTSGNWAIATVVGRAGARRIVTSNDQIEYYRVKGGKSIYPQ